MHNETFPSTFSGYRTWRRALAAGCILTVLGLPAFGRAEGQDTSALLQNTGSDAVLTAGKSIPSAPGAGTTSSRILLHRESSSLCLAMDAHGALYVADETAGTVRCLTRDGESGVLVSGLRGPSAVAVDHRRQLIVGTRFGEIWKIAPDGSAILLERGAEAVVSVTVDRDGAAIAATTAGNVIRINAR